MTSILTSITAPVVTTDTVIPPAVLNETDAQREADEALLARIDQIEGLIESGDINLDTMRGYYSTTYGKDTSLDDDDIIRILAESEDDMPAKEWAGLMREAEKASADTEMEVTTETSLDVMTIAHNLGGKLANDTFVSNMKAINAASELAKRGDAIIYMQLTAMWNDDDWARVPVPGTKKGETGNKPFDKWSVKDHANDGKMLKYSWFEEVAKAIPYYQDTVTELADATDVLKKEPELGTPRRVEFRTKWSKPKLQAWKATLAQRKTKILGTIKKACALKVQYDRVAALPGIKVQVLMETQPDGRKEVMATTSPIEISHADKPSVCLTYTTTTFLKLKPEEARASAKDIADAMFAALDATLTRAPKGGGKDKSGAAAKYPPVESPTDWDSWQAAGANFADNQDNVLRLRKWLTEGNIEERDEKIDNFATFALAVQGVWVKVRPLFEEKQQRDAAAVERASRAGLQKTGT